MGACFSSGNDRQTSNNRVVLFLGLDGSGSTTMLYQLLLGRHLHTIPTLGNNHETVSAHGMELDCWDIGGLEKMRHLWTQYSREADGIVFVVDSTDPGRFDLAARELNRVYKVVSDDSDEDDGAVAGNVAAPDAPKKAADGRHIPIEEVPLLVFANKMDLPTAESVSDISGALRIGALPCKHKHIAACSAMDLTSLQSGLRWMTDHFKSTRMSTTLSTSPVSQ